MRVVIQPPATEAISLGRARLHLRAEEGDDDDEDGAIVDSIVAVREMLEAELLRPLLPQVCEVHVDTFARRIRLWQDVTEIQMVTYLDESGARVSMSPGRYLLADKAAMVLLGDPPVASDVCVRFACGAFAEPAAVPRSLIQWMLLQLGSLYEIRQGVTHGQTFSTPESFTAGLINRYRILGL